VVDLLENDAVEGARVVDYDPQGSRGGSVSITPEGILTYQATLLSGVSAQQEAASETFTYTIENEAGSSQATVTAKAVRAIHVNAQAPGPGNGSQASPFQDLAAAVSSAGGQPAHFVVAAGYYNVGSLTLGQGQSLTGADAKNPPRILGQMQLATVDCALENAVINGYVGGTLSQPCIVASGTFTGDPLILKNLQLPGNNAEGIVLTNPGNTQLTNLVLESLNGIGGQAGVVVHEPLGTVTLSNLDLRNTGPAGVLVTNVVSPNAFSLDPVTVQLNKYRPQAVQNPLVVKADVGNLELRLSGLISTRDDSLSGTLVSADVSQQAVVNAWLSSLDWREIGLKTNLLDWTYRDSSQGVVRATAATTDLRVVDINAPVWQYLNNNPLYFQTRGKAQASIVLSNAPLSVANQANLDAYDQSLMKVRLQKYGWNSSITLELPNFVFNVYAHDQAQIFNRITCDGDGRAPGSFSWDCDLTAGQRFESWFNFPEDNPDSDTFWAGYDADGSSDYDRHPFRASVNLARNYSNAEIGELQIPNP
jgi:hypothetical protein